MTTESIKATFNGSDQTFRIHREDLPYFEAQFGSAYAMYKRITAGLWTSSDLLNVVRFAGGQRPPKATDPMQVQLWAAMASIRANATPCAIEAAFIANGPATYAPLAALVLSACLVGIAEDDATFSDVSADDI